MSCPCDSSGLLDASAVVSAIPGRVVALQVEADGTNAATAIVYDNATAASGTELMKVIVDATLTNGSVVIPDGVRALNGLYLSLSGTGAKAIVNFSVGE